MKRLLIYVLMVVVHIQSSWAHESFFVIDSLLSREQYKEALELLRSHTTIKNCKDLSKKAQRQERLGLVFYGLCDYAAAIKCYEQALDLYVSSPETIEVQARCNRRIAELMLHSELGTTEELGNQVLSTVKMLAEDRDPSQREYNMLAMNLLLGRYVNQLAGDYEAALDRCHENEQLLRGRLKKDPEILSEVHATQLLKGDASVTGGRFEEALRVYYELLEETEPDDHAPRLALASLYRRIGVVHAQLNNADDALACYNKSEAIYQKMGRTDHDEYARLLYERGVLFKAMSHYDRAIDEFRQAEAIQTRIFGGQHISVFRTKLEWMECRMANDPEGDGFAELLDCAETASSLAERYFADFRRWIEICAKGFFDMRMYDQAIGMLEGVIDLNKSQTESALYNSREAYYLMGESYWMKLDIQQTLACYQQMFDLERRFVRDVFAFLPESKRASYWASCNEHMNGLFEINRQQQLDSGSELPSLLYDAALFHKGLLLETSIGIADIVNKSRDSSLLTDFNHLQNIRQQQLRGSNFDPERFRTMQAEAEDLERRVLNKVRVYGNFMQFADTGWENVRDALHDDEVAIEFVSSSSIRHGTVYYSAEILRHDWSAPRHVFLFALSPGEQGRWQRPSVYENPILGRKIWSRILPLLKLGDRIYFAATGDLHNTAIEYLMIDDSTRINDRFLLYRLSSTRQVVFPQKQESDQTAVLYGGLNYNTDPEEMSLYAAAFGYKRSARQLRINGAGEHNLWNYLRGTREEVDQIGALLGGNRYEVLKYTGDEGIEESFKALSGQNKRIIHLATHGFYLPEGESKEPGRLISAEDSELLRAGLVLTGANRAWVGTETIEGEDGILTAKEISLLDLRGSDLVTLSACQTGLGRVSGDGVFGLQRGFKKAGAQTLLMSLWNVDDRATQLMMTAFYKALISGQDKREALRRAQNQVRQETFVVDGVSRSGLDPYFWASFILLD